MRARENERGPTHVGGKHKRRGSQDGWCFKTFHLINQHTLLYKKFYIKLFLFSLCLEVSPHFICGCLNVRALHCIPLSVCVSVLLSATFILSISPAFFHSLLCITFIYMVVLTFMYLVNNPSKSGLERQHEDNKRQDTERMQKIFIFIRLKP